MDLLEKKRTKGNNRNRRRKPWLTRNHRWNNRLLVAVVGEGEGQGQGREEVGGRRNARRKIKWTGK